MTTTMTMATTAPVPEQRARWRAQQEAAALQPAPVWDAHKRRAAEA